LLKEAVIEIRPHLQQLDAVFMPLTPIRMRILIIEPPIRARLEDIINACDGHNLDGNSRSRADALRLPDWDAMSPNYRR